MFSKNYINIAKNIIKIEPLPMPPGGKIFFLDYKYGIDETINLYSPYCKSCNNCYTAISDRDINCKVCGFKV